MNKYIGVLIECSATMKSSLRRGHTHTCVGEHDSRGDHFCGICHSWWQTTKV